MSNKKFKKIKKYLQKFWEKYEQKIILILGMILVAIISFEIGVLQGQKWQQSPLIIESANKQVCGAYSNNDIDRKDNDSGITLKATDNLNEDVLSNKKRDCAFIASKKSTKYHKASCRFAKKIKPENLICFKDKEDARKKGYVPAHCLKK